MGLNVLSHHRTGFRFSRLCVSCPDISLTVAGDDEALRLALSACLGMLVKHVSAEEARQVLLRGPLGPPAHSKAGRINHALLLASIAHCAPER